MPQAMATTVARADTAVMHTAVMHTVGISTVGISTVGISTVGIEAVMEMVTDTVMAAAETGDTGKAGMGKAAIAITLESRFASNPGSRRPIERASRINVRLQDVQL